jgi:hypothetical protein
MFLSTKHAEIALKKMRPERCIRPSKIRAGIKEAAPCQKKVYLFMNRNGILPKKCIFAAY